MTKDNLLQEIREFFSESLLGEGVAPSEATFGLAFIATEMGMFLAESKPEVYEVLFAGICAGNTSYDNIMKSEVETPKDKNQPDGLPITIIKKLH